MLISINWLKELVDIDASPVELAESLSLSGLEVEQTEQVGPSLEGVVVGHVIDVQPHPNADRLTLCKVDIADGEPVQIVCGAPNVKAGQFVPVATPGCTLTIKGRQVQIKRARLRGERSAGMICAEDELGLSDDHSGIMVLEDAAIKGEALETYLQRTGRQVADTVMDIVVTPNRPDAACHIGVARDVAALADTPLRLPAIEDPKSSSAIDEHVSVAIACPELCRRYVALLVTGVKVGPSPQWLQDRLSSVGLRPINNIVDVTNYVMYECGQPLHAFDYARLAGAKIIVRASREGEQMSTLDGKRHTLPSGVVLICDDEQPVALGGVMGGANSEVEENTTHVLIESAWFDPSCTRRSARKLGIQTDASYRFERGVDASGQLRAAARAAELMCSLAGGTLVDGYVDAHPNPLVLPEITLRLSRIPKILGITIPPDEVTRILQALGFEVNRQDDLLHCQVPPHRPDVSIEVDLIEEVARIHGLDKIAEPTATPLPGSVALDRPIDALRESVHRNLNGKGFREIYTNSLMNRDEAETFSDPALGTGYPVVETLNPVSSTMTTLRPTLLPGMLRVMQFNTHHGQDPLRFYEFGHVFHRIDEHAVYIEGYAEYETLLMAASGPVRPPGWDGQGRNVDIYDIKGDVESLLVTLGLAEVQMESYLQPTAVTAHQIILNSNNQRLGCIARLSDEQQQAWDLRAPVYFAEFNWTRLVLHSQEYSRQTYTSVNRHPVADRDIAVTVPRVQTVGPMLETIRKSGSPLLQHVRIFDLYEDERFGASRKSLAFALRFGARRTLRDEEIDRAVERIVKALHELYAAELRS